MAFSIPSHLPRQVDVSSQILSKIDSVTFQSLDSAIASSWRMELDESIRLTKKRIHDRIYANFPAFEAQLASARSAQQRLQSLSSGVDTLGRVVSDPEDGLTPTLLEALRRHQALAQASLNADVLHASLSHLSECKSQLEVVQKLVDSGNLPTSVPASAKLTQLLQDTPPPLGEATVLLDMKSKLRVLTNRVEELLNNAYTQSVVVSPTEISVRPSVLVANSQNPIPLSAVLSSLSSTSLSSHMTSLRRDLAAHYIDRSLEHPTSLAISTEPDPSGLLVHKLQRLPSPSTTPDVTPLENLSCILEFINDELFPCLPPSQLDAFPRSLAKPLITSIMTRLLIPSLPSKLEDLSPFLELASKSVDFETKYVVRLLKSDPVEREIKNWVHNVCAHYERGRRLRILDDVRATVLASASRPKDTVMAELVIPTTKALLTNGKHEPESQPKPEPEPEVDSWGFDDDSSSKTDSSSTALDAEDAWGFDDEVGEPEEPPAPKPEPVEEAEPDPGDAWGWDEELPTDDKELYPVSAITRHIVQAVEEALREGKALASSGIFSGSSPSGSAPGTLIMQTGALVLELYCALYPVTAGSRVSRPADRMQFSNDYFYISEEISRILGGEQGVPSVQEKLEECEGDLKVLADSWYHGGIEKQVTALEEVLAEADGFTDTSDQERYDECEMVITRVLRDIRSVANAWKPILPKSKYYAAVGLVVDGVLSRILESILTISDIPEVESHKLSELCRILSALEGLFVDSTSESSFVVSYVPSWLKFSYLSELLEASMADLTYLFEEGTLVDFETDELVKLVKALFADTPLRTKTLNKIVNGNACR